MRELEVLDTVDWRLRAACAQIPVAQADRFFFGSTTTDLEQGRALCATCPVRTECLDLADATETGTLGARTYMAGIYGGLYPRGRRDRRRNRT